MIDLAKLTDAELIALQTKLAKIGLARCQYLKLFSAFDIEGDISRSIGKDIEILKLECLQIEEELERRKIP